MNPYVKFASSHGQSKRRTAAVDSKFFFVTFPSEETHGFSGSISARQLSPLRICHGVSARWKSVSRKWISSFSTRIFFESYVFYHFQAVIQPLAVDNGKCLSDALSTHPFLPAIDASLWSIYTFCNNDAPSFSNPYQFVVCSVRDLHVRCFSVCVDNHLCISHFPCAYEHNWINELSVSLAVRSAHYKAINLDKTLDKNSGTE